MYDRRTQFFVSVVLACVVVTSAPAADVLAPSWPSGLPVYDHIVIVVEENKDYDEIIGNSKAPYINDVLKKEGANFTRMFGEEHHSQGNYFWLFAGSNCSVGFDDVVPNAMNHSPYPITDSNLAQQLIAQGKTFKAYSEDLPAIGDKSNVSPNGLYARKHAPWVSFGNIPNGTTKDDSVNLRFVDFPTDFNQLPTVSFVIPNLKNDMHDGAPAISVPRGDAWLKQHLDSYYQWSKTHNSLLILTVDENNDRQNFRGLTSPQVSNLSTELHRDIQNRVATIFAGAHVKAGDYTEGKGITHVNILRTIESMYGLPKSGLQQPNASGYGISDTFIITDIFQ